MNKHHTVKVTLPNGKERLVIKFVDSEEEAIDMTRQYILSMMTKDGLLSGEEAAQEIEHYEIMMATNEEARRLVYRRIFYDYNHFG